MAVSPPIIPCPCQIEQIPGTFNLVPQTVIVADSPNGSNAQYLQNRLSTAMGYSLLMYEEHGNPGVYLQLEENIRDLGEDGYHLEVTAASVKIKAPII